GDEEEDAEGREREGGRLQFHPRQDGGRDERSGDRGGDREGQALDRQARRPREVEDDEKRGRHAEADHRETEHEPAEVGPGRLSRAQEDPEVLPLREGPVHREDSEEEREGLRDGDRGDFVRPRATEAGRQDHEEGEQADEHDAPVPPDPDQMEARHEPGVTAAVRPRAEKAIEGNGSSSNRIGNPGTATPRAGSNERPITGRVKRRTGTFGNRMRRITNTWEVRRTKAT